jgi:GntR family transcriptional regulator
MRALNQASALPLYAQLAEQILGQIRAGDLPVGEKIPSETELAETFHLGRPTVRQATEVLVRRGYLMRKRGSGTFVVDRSKHIGLFSLGSTLESFSEQGYALETRIVQKAKLVTEEVQEENPLSGRPAFRVRRLGLVEKQPVLLETFWFDEDVFPGFDQFELEGKSLSELILSQFRMEVTSAEQRFSVRLLEAREAKLLGMKPREPVLHVNRVLHFRSASSAVFVEMDCRSDRFTFSQSISSEGPLIVGARTVPNRG